MSSDPIQYASIAYAPLTHGTRVWAAIWVTVTGFILAGISGCFFIGIMALNNPAMVGNKTATIWTPQNYLLAAVLYIIAFGFLAGAVVTIVAGVRRLLTLIT